ncbi:MAG: MFS transporter [Propionibacteriaceae bacterium]|nr:MFS transporter [Propionibacteriaceae bacterium]
MVGSLLVFGGVACVVWAIVRAPTAGWESPITVGFALASAILLVAFAVWERRTPSPLVPLRPYTNRPFVLTNLVAFCMHVGVFGAIFLLAQYLQIGFPFGPLEAGLRTMLWTVMPMVIAPMAGRLTPTLGGGWLMAAGMALQAVALSWVAVIARPGLDFGWMAPAMMVAGMGLVLAPIATTVLATVESHEHAVATGVNLTGRELGGALGIAILGSVFAHLGGYSSAGEFTAGLRPALQVGVAACVLGVMGAVLVGGAGRRPSKTDSTSPPSSGKLQLQLPVIDQAPSTQVRLEMRRHQRTIYRAIHIVVAVFLGTFVYAPAHFGEPLRPFLAFVGIPLVALTGLLMYRPRLAPWNGSRSGRPRQTAAANDG